LIFSLLLLAGVAVEVVAISRLAEVYRLDGVRGKAISAAAVLWLGVVVAGVMPLIEPQLIFFSRTVEYFAVLIWAVLMWRVYKRFASFTGAFADAATWHDYHSLRNYYSYTTTATLPTCRVLCVSANQGVDVCNSAKPWRATAASRHSKASL